MVRTIASTTRPWAQVTIPRRGMRPARTEFHFNPQYLRRVWQARDAGARGTFYVPESRRFIFQDVLHHDEYTLFVEAWLVQSDEPAYYHLHVKVAAAPRLPKNGELTLHWDTDSYSMPLRAGVMEFEYISLPKYSRLRQNLPSPRFRLSFEFLKERKNGKH